MMCGDGQNDVIHETAYFEPDRSGLWERAMRRLFPSKHVAIPDVSWAAKDCLVVYAVTRFSWADRLRILLTGTVEATVKGVVEQEMGRIECVSEVYPVRSSVWERSMEVCRSPHK